MEQLFNWLFLILFLGACTDKENNSENSDEIVFEIPIDLANQADKKEHIKSWLTNRYFKINQELFIEEIDDSVNGLLIYKIRLGEGWPNNLFYFYTIIYNKEGKKSFILPIDFIQIYNIDNQLMIGGVHSYREFEYYSIYEINNSEVRQILPEIGAKATTIGFFRDDECEVYFPHRFVYRYSEKDRRIEFSGTIENYCKPNVDRIRGQKQPVSKKDTQIVYQFIDRKWVEKL